ncbi:MAG: lytic transglycosylase domain-containing protein [Candidatus Acidiferrales bacterium]
MKKNPSICIFALAGFILGLGLPVRAQIASQVDEHGKFVFVNADPPAGHRSVQSSASRNVRFRFSPKQPNTPPAPALLPDNLERIVQHAAEKNRLDPALVKAVIGVESGGNPGAVSRKGAMGLMQLVPSTAESLGVNNAFDPAQNVEAGTRYLKSLLERYNGDLTKSLAAYNAGEGAVERYGGVPNFPETRAYVERVTDTYFQPGSGRLPSAWSAPTRPIRKTVDEKGRVVFTNE